MRLSCREVKKIILYHRYFNHTDTCKTIEMYNGFRYAARQVQHFTNGNVNVLLINDDEIVIPLNQIKSFKTIQENTIINEPQAQRRRFTASLSYGALNNNVGGIQYALGMLLNRWNNLSLQFKAGQFIMSQNRGLIVPIWPISSITLPPTSRQANANNAIKSEKFTITKQTNQVNHQIFLLSAKAYFYLFGSRVKHTAGMGLNCYFGGKSSVINAQTDLITLDRKIMAYDSLTAMYNLVSEPIEVKVTTNETYKRNTFCVFDLSYQISYKINKKVALINEVGLLMGNATLTKRRSIKADYTYLSGNFFNDETGYTNDYKDITRKPFDQIYAQIGIIF